MYKKRGQFLVWYNLDTLLKYGKFYILCMFILYFSLTQWSPGNDINSLNILNTSLIEDPMSVYCNQIFLVQKQVPELGSPILTFSFLSRPDEINEPTQRVTYSKWKGDRNWLLIVDINPLFWNTKLRWDKNYFLIVIIQETYQSRANFLSFGKNNSVISSLPI